MPPSREVDAAGAKWKYKNRTAVAGPARASGDDDQGAADRPDADQRATSPLFGRRT